MPETQWTISAWAEETFPARNGQAQGVRAQAIKLVGEAVELAIACGCSQREVDVCKAFPFDPASPGDYDLKRAVDADAIPPEVADVAIVLSVLASRAGIHIQDEVDAKMRRNRFDRKWTTNADGSAQHVKEGADA